MHRTSSSVIYTDYAWSNTIYDTHDGQELSDYTNSAWAKLCVDDECLNSASIINTAYPWSNIVSMILEHLG